MKLAQYVYGRMPRVGLQVLARSRELPFVNNEHMASQRYGAAPTRETPDRIWTQRYELQCFEEGAVLSCLYPLKQTMVPCREQTPPYINGITPAAHHVLAAAEDVPQLLNDPYAALRFDPFFPIDDIYHLPETFLEPVDFEAATGTPCLENETWWELCVDMAAFLWRAFAIRHEQKFAQLAMKRVLLIVPAGSVETELEAQRIIMGASLSLLPMHIRRWASVTFNMEVESDTLPNGSAVYCMSRAKAGSTPLVSGVVFDAQTCEWPRATDEERAYFLARRAGGPICLLDDFAAQLPDCLTLEHNLELMTLLNDVLSNRDVRGAVKGFLQSHDANDSSEALCMALAQAVRKKRNGAPQRGELAILWQLASLLPHAAQLLMCEESSLSEVLSVLIRDGVLTDQPLLTSPDEVLIEGCIRLAAHTQEPLPDETVYALRGWMERCPCPVEMKPLLEGLVNALYNHRLLPLNSEEGLLIWLPTRLFSQLQNLTLKDDAAALFSTAEPSRLADTLLRIALRQKCSWVSDAEALLLRQLNGLAFAPDWSEPDCMRVVERIGLLAAPYAPWPELLMRRLAEQAAPSGACFALLKLEWVRCLPQMQPYLKNLHGYLTQHNLEELLSSIREPKELLLLTERWREISGGEALSLPPAHWQTIQRKADEMLNGLQLSELADLSSRIEASALPSEGREMLAQSIAGRAVAALEKADVSALPVGVISWVTTNQHILSAPRTLSGEQRLKALQIARSFSEPESGPLCFSDMRANAVGMTPEVRGMLQSLLAPSANPAAILLCNLTDANTIRFKTALPALMRASGMDRSDPESAIRRTDDAEQLLSLLCSLFRDWEWPGHMLTAEDRQALCGWLRQSCPKVCKWLQKEERKFGDLPLLLVEGLQLKQHK